MQKEIPILFSTEMVQAILEGRKTQTRRTRGMDLINECPDDWDEIFLDKRSNWQAECESWEGYHIQEVKCPYGAKGDLLWARETWQETTWLHPSDDQYGYIYKASENGKEWAYNYAEWKWRPSIHMPKAAARIWLEVTDVRVERLQDISEYDAIAEGIIRVTKDNNIFKYCAYNLDDYSSTHWTDMPYTAKEAFQKLWEKINNDPKKPTSHWNKNPWVWVISFKVLSTTGKPQ